MFKSSIEYYTSSDCTDDEQESKQKPVSVRNNISQSINTPPRIGVITSAVFRVTPLPAAVVSANSSKLMVKCTKCPKSLDATKFQAHMEVEHEKCKYCVNFMPHSAMKGHVERNHPNMIGASNSNSLPQTSTQTQFKENQANTVQCRYCSKKMLATEYQAHLEVEHGKCKYCENYFKSNTSKQNHIERKHPSMISKDDASSSVSLTSTQTNPQGAQGKNVKCGYCPKEFPKNEINAHHERDHEKCKYCQNYMDAKSIEKHVKRMHPDKILVNRVTNSMPQTSTQTNAQEKLLKMVKCQYCTEKRSEQDIKQHEATHLVRCTHCDDMILGSNLNSHIETKHKIQTIIGMIQLSKIGDDRFNQLINEKRIYAKDGFLYIK